MRALHPVQDNDLEAHETLVFKTGSAADNYA